MATANGTLAPRSPRFRLQLRAGCAAIGLCAVAAIAGCSTMQPRQLGGSELAEAQIFPYFLVYWVGPRFNGYPLAAADGQQGYVTSVGDSVYYGDCVNTKGILSDGSCPLPLQVTTVIYHRHSNAPLGTQRNLIVRGVPAVSYDEGQSLEVYTGRLAIDIFSDSEHHALEAAERLLPLNAPGSASGNLPPPVYCPELARTVSVQVERVLEALPGQVCQRAEAELSYAKSVAHG